MSSKPEDFEMVIDSIPCPIQFVRGGTSGWWTVRVDGELFASAKRNAQNEWQCMRGPSRYFGRTAQEAAMACVKEEIRKK